MRLTRTEHETDAEHCCTEDDCEQRTNRGRKPGERGEDGQDAEQNECTGTRHARSISGRHYDHKFSPYAVGVFSEIGEHFCWRTGNELLVHFGKLARNHNPRHRECF